VTVLLLAGGIIWWLNSGEPGVVIRPATSTGPTPPAVASLTVGQGKMFPTIGAALKEAKPDSEIHVYPGIYKESLIITKSITIVGKGDPAEIIMEATDACCLTMEAETATIQNLTLLSLKTVAGKNKHAAVQISHGRAKFINCFMTSQSGSGLDVEGPNSNPSLTGCKLSKCAEAGISIHTQAFCSLEKCDMTENTTGVLVDTKGSFKILGGKITANEKVGIFVNEGKDCNLEKTEISANRMAGVQIHEGGLVTFRKCFIKQNQWAGVHVSKTSWCKLYDCDILENRDGGVQVADKGSEVVLEYCRIIGNRGMKGGQKLPGVLVWDGAIARINSCELYDNEGGPWIEVPPGQVIANDKNKFNKTNDSN
jgi:nitrous oxidase accessory protein NosD